MEAATSVPGGLVRLDSHAARERRQRPVCAGRPPAISTFAAAMPVGAAAFVLFPLTMHQRYTVVSLLVDWGNDGEEFQ